MEGNLEGILILIIYSVPALILGLKLREVSVEQEVSFFNNEIITKSEGAIHLGDIVKYKSPTEYQISAKDYIEIILQNNQKFTFSAISRQFKNKKHQQVFEGFAADLEAKKNNLSERK